MGRLFDLWSSGFTNEIAAYENNYDEGDDGDHDNPLQLTLLLQHLDKFCICINDDVMLMLSEVMIMIMMMLILMVLIMMMMVMFHS